MANSNDFSNLTALAQTINNTAEFGLKIAQESNSIARSLDSIHESSVMNAVFSLKSSAVTNAVAIMENVSQPISQTNSTLQLIENTLELSSSFTQSVAAEDAMSSPDDSIIGPVEKLESVLNLYDRSAELQSPSLSQESVERSINTEILRGILEASSTFIDRLVESITKLLLVISEKIHEVIDSIEPTMMLCLHNLFHWITHALPKIKLISFKDDSPPKSLYLYLALVTVSYIKEVQIDFLEHAQNHRRINLIRIQNRGEDSDSSDKNILQLLVA